MIVPDVTDTDYYRPTFPESCLTPEQPGYGQVLPSLAIRRKRRPAQPVPAGSISAPPTAGPSAVHRSSHSPTAVRTDTKTRPAYTPMYPLPPLSNAHSEPDRLSSMSPRFSPYLSTAPTSQQLPAHRRSRTPSAPATTGVLPPIYPASRMENAASLRLPPISMFQGSGQPFQAGSGPEDAQDVLRRLRQSDQEEAHAMLVEGRDNRSSSRIR
jgi:hypothetical protein